MSGPRDDLDLDGLALEALAGALTPLAPPPAARDRLLQSLRGPDRFRPLFAELGRRFDLALDPLRAVLALIDDPTRWLPGPLPGVRLIHFTAGPALGDADTGFVHVPAGMTFPLHRHLGPEMAFVLEGSVHDGGRVHGPGAVVEWSAGSIHDYRAAEGRDLVVIVAHHGIELVR
jgi:putative transcriptional regulator